MKDPPSPGGACSLEGGTLDPSNYAAFAQYLASFIDSYRAEGIPIWAITPQNELSFPGPKSILHYPSMDWPTPGVDPGVDDETGFIAHQLGPLLQADHLLQTEILDFDSNYSKAAIPETILSDSAASSYTSGTAWHGYSGSPSAIQSLLQAFPAKANYLTEHAGNPGGAAGDCGPAASDSYYGACEYSHQLDQVIEALKNGAQGAMLWNLALDQNHGGHNPGTTPTGVGLIEIDNTNPTTPIVTPNPDYYAIGQFSRYLQPGAVQIVTNQNSPGDGTAYDAVAFRNPDGTVVLVATNTTGHAGGEMLQVNWVEGAKPIHSFTYDLGVDPTAVSGFDYGEGYTFKWAGSPETVLTTAGWTATASSSVHGSLPANMLDGSPTSRWSSGAPQAPGQWFEVDMGSSQPIDEVTMDSDDNPSDYPRRYQVDVSVDGSNWQQVAQGPPSGPFVTASFRVRTVRYIRVIQNGTALNWWSVDGFAAYG